MSYRPELPEVPARIAALPVHRGYPVPWFVGWVDADGHACERGVGTPDFRVLHPGAPQEAHRWSRCWICGGRLGSLRAFVVGPMCAVNRTSAEPPMHVGCADWSVRGCPFLTRPDMVRREAGLPEDATAPPGTMLRRNPGVSLVWVVRRYALKRAPDGWLFDLGDPERVEFWREGRRASRAEVLASIESGIPTLREMAELQGGRAPAVLEREVARAMELLPA